MLEGIGTREGLLKLERMGIEVEAVVHDAKAEQNSIARDVFPEARSRNDLWHERC